jgi:hypothetical protein
VVSAKRTDITVPVVVNTNVVMAHINRIYSGRVTIETTEITHTHSFGYEVMKIRVI